MGQDKRKSQLNGQRRHASATPQRPPNQHLQSVIDLTMTDPWANANRNRASSVVPMPVSKQMAKPTPLSPSFGVGSEAEAKAGTKPGAAVRATTISVPQDHKSSPAYLFQQLALARNRASHHRSFISALRLDDDDKAENVKGKDEATRGEKRDETPTPGEKKKVADEGVNVRESSEIKKKKKPKDKDEKQKAITSTHKSDKKTAKEGGKDKKNKEKTSGDERNKKNKEKAKEGKKDNKDKKDKDKAREEENKEREREKRKSQKAKKREERRQDASMMEGTPAKPYLKRKRGDLDGESFTLRVDHEMNAVKKLRESLPTTRIARVARNIEREEGFQPSEMAVLLITARETVIDLARSHLAQTEKSCHAVQKELLNLVKAQQEKLEALDGTVRSKKDWENKSASKDDDEREDMVETTSGGQVERNDTGEGPGEDEGGNLLRPISGT